MSIRLFIRALQMTLLGHGTINYSESTSVLKGSAEVLMGNLKVLGRNLKLSVIQEWLKVKAFWGDKNPYVYKNTEQNVLQ